MAEDITPVGASVTIGDRTYIVHPRVTSSACLRGLRRLAESHNRESAREAMAEADRLLKSREISAEAYQRIMDEATRLFTRREHVAYEDLGDWIQNVEGLATIVSVCCDIGFEEAMQIVPGHLGEWVTAIMASLNQEIEAEKN